MQKKIVAVALAGLSTAAFAQIAPQNDFGASSVTIYGVADVSVQGVNASGGTNISTTLSASDSVANGGKTRVESNSSLIGFKGVEALGNGTSAIFQLESTINLTGANNGTANGDRSGTAGKNTNGSTTADGNAFGVLRDSGVGIDSKYGRFIAGYWSTPYRQTVSTMDVMPGAAGDGRIDNIFGRIATRTATTTLTAYTRATAMQYSMPTLYGFNGNIAYTGQGSNNLTDNNTAGFNQALSLNIGWTGYGFNPQFAFSQMKLQNPNTSSTDLVTAGAVANSPTSVLTNYVVGGSYTGVPGLKISALYGRNSLGINAGSYTTGGTTGSNKLSSNSVYLGTSYRFGNNEPRISWQLTSNTNGANTTDATSVYTQNGGKQWALGWGYYLSKRTQVYGLYTQINQNANANYTFANAPTAQSGLNGTRQQTYGAGIRTNF